MGWNLNMDTKTMHIISFSAPYLQNIVVQTTIRFSTYRLTKHSFCLVTHNSPFDHLLNFVGLLFPEIYSLQNVLCKM